MCKQIYVVVAIAIFCFAACSFAAESKTIIVSAEGLADPEAKIYQNDRGLLIDDLREDARRQVIEKAVGTMVDSATLVENYTLVYDRVFTQSQGLIKRIVKESSPWLGDDGFMHILLKAEVYLGGVRESLKDLSRSGRVDLIRQQGNPRIEVKIYVRDAKRGSRIQPERSFIAENILKEHFKSFGYRVWSEGEKGTSSADFAVRGEARFKTLSVRLKASGLTITKHVLTSWSVKCINLRTAEEIYFNNKIPRGKSWTDEDAALADIGALVGNEFSRDFFSDHLMEPSKIFALQVSGLPDYDTGTLLKKEFLGLRHVLNVDFREFSAHGESLFEIDFSGSRQNFMESVNSLIVKPLNRKLGRRAFRLISARGEVVQLDFVSSLTSQEISSVLEGQLPASLYDAAPQRLNALIKDEVTREKLRKINPQAIDKLGSVADKTNSRHSQIRDF